MSKVIIKTTKRETTVSRWAVRKAVSDAYANDPSSTTNNSFPYSTKRAAKKAARKKSR